MKHSEYMKIYHKSHREERRKYDMLHHDRILSQRREWRRTHKEHIRLRDGKWRMEHPEWVSRNNHSYYQSHLESAREKRRAYGQRNIMVVRERWQRWHMANPEKTRMAKRNAESKHRGLPPFEAVLNDSFLGSHLHHMGNGLGIYITSTLHKTISHSLIRNFNMDMINEASLAWVIGEVEKG